MLKTKKYNFSELTSMTLDGMYAGDSIILKNLDKNLISIIETEAPITLNTLKQRLRTAFNVKKISQKALDIIEEHINKLGFYITDNLYDKVYWPRKGQFKIDYLRIDGERLIYDIPYQELINLAKSLNLRGEVLYREILKYFGFEVLTEKARTYLEFVEEKVHEKD